MFIWNARVVFQSRRRLWSGTRLVPIYQSPFGVHNKPLRVSPSAYSGVLHLKTDRKFANARSLNGCLECSSDYRVENSRIVEAVER